MAAPDTKQKLRSAEAKGEHENHQQMPFHNDEYLPLGGAEFIGIHKITHSVINKNQTNDKTEKIESDFQKFRFFFTDHGKQYVYADVCPQSERPWRAQKNNHIKGILNY